MNAADLTNFFYNLVPGLLFILGLDFLRLPIPRVHMGDFEGGIIFIGLCLFLGFCFQGLTKFSREQGLNEYIFKKIKENPESKNEFNRAKEILENQIHDNCPDDIKLLFSDQEAFYFMDDFLRGKPYSAGPIHFSSRFALWSNMFFASFVYMVLIYFIIFFDLFTFSINSSFFTLLALLIVSKIFIAISIYLSYKYFYAYYDVVLKTFIVVTLLKDK